MRKYRRSRTSTRAIEWHDHGGNGRRGPLAALRVGHHPTMPPALENEAREDIAPAFLARWLFSSPVPH